jgi:hypothetical protein
MVLLLSEVMVIDHPLSLKPAAEGLPQRETFDHVSTARRMTGAGVYMINAAPRSATAPTRELRDDLMEDTIKQADAWDCTEPRMGSFMKASTSTKRKRRHRSLQRQR